MNMKAWNINTILLLTTACCLDAIAQSTESDTLTIEADTPIIEVGIQAAGRNFIKLPSLQYDILLNAQCVSGFLPKVMTLSVADTRKMLSHDGIATDTLTATNFTVPAAQIAPVAVDGFCIAATDDQSGNNDTLTIMSVISLQSSLLCANETESRMIYSSSGLDVTLLCKAPAQPAESTLN